MRSFALAIVCAVANAARVHEFFAEKNYICELCKQAVGYAAKGRDIDLQNLYQQFPKLEQRFNYFSNEAGLINLAEPEATCQKITLCEDGNILDLLHEEQPLNLTAHIEAVNLNPKSNWVAGHNNKFTGASLKEIKSLMGTIVDPDWVIDVPAARETVEVVSDSLPETFDARQEWPDCAGVINHIRDQSNCGSCWAHGTTEALNDRMCVNTIGRGAYTTLLSVSDTTACCDMDKCNSMGCNGGQIGQAWKWLDSEGAVTGGDYGTTGTCYNYTMPKCAHHVTSETLPLCDDVKQVAPKCVSICPDDHTSHFYGDDKHRAASHYKFRSVNQIKRDLHKNGPVTSAFTVYEDFLTYKSGVYSHQTGSALGGHAIKTIGWGSENGEDYWLCVNSWNNTWGDQGTFKIKMGEGGINDQMYAGLPASPY